MRILIKLKGTHKIGALVQKRNQQAHDGGVELRSGVLLQHGICVFDGHPFPIWPVGRHGVERVAHQDDARLDRNRAGRQPVRIAAPIEALVTVANDGANRSKTSDGAQNSLP